MNKRVTLAGIVLGCILFAATAWAGGSYVRGHWRDADRDGVKETWVNSHRRTAPDNMRSNNYGYPGNYNPNTMTVTPYNDGYRNSSRSNSNPYKLRY